MRQPIWVPVLQRTRLAKLRRIASIVAQVMRPAIRPFHRMLKYTSAALLACLASWVVSAKCGNSVIVVTGQIIGPTDGSVVSVEVVPDPNWNSQPPAVIDPKGQFRVTVYFDRTKPGQVEKCSRKPRTVTLQLHRNGQLVDELTLRLKRDFLSKDNTDYSVRSSVVLRSR
jgi:hypothetical protein